MLNPGPSMVNSGILHPFPPLIIPSFSTLDLIIPLLGLKLQNSWYHLS